MERRNTRGKVGTILIKEGPSEEDGDIRYWRSSSFRNKRRPMEVKLIFPQSSRTRDTNNITVVQTVVSQVVTIAKA